jgi:hypothetical protein
MLLTPDKGKANQLITIVASVDDQNRFDCSQWKSEEEMKLDKLHAEIRLGE